MVLFQVEKCEDVSVPRLDVHCERPLSLPAALIDIPRGVVEYTHHWNTPVRCPIASTHVTVSGSNVMYGQSDAPSELRYCRAEPESVVYSLDGVLLDGQQETRRELWARRSSIE